MGANEILSECDHDVRKVREGVAGRGKRREHACKQGVHHSHYRVLRIRWVVYALKNLLGVIRCAEMPES